MIVLATKRYKLVSTNKYKLPPIFSLRKLICRLWILSNIEYKNEHPWPICAFCNENVQTGAKKKLTAYKYLRVIYMANAESFTNDMLHLIATNWPVTLE